MAMTQKRVWLRRELSTSDNGHYQFEGDCGRERVVVVIDPTIIARLGPEKREGLLALHRKIEEAATSKMNANEAYPVHPHGRIEERYLLITLTDEDVNISD